MISNSIYTSVDIKSIKLTPKQNSVIYCLQNGWELITDNEVKGAWVCNNKYQYHINNGLFFKLVYLGLIAQSIEKRDNFNYMLTKEGKNIKTKTIDLTIYK